MRRAIPWLVFVACALPLCWAVISVVQEIRAAAALKSARQDLKQLMTAMQQYHDDHGSFPPAYVKGPDGDRWHSWRALLLPYVAPQIAASYRYDEPWNSPHNSKLAEPAPPVFQSDAASPGPSATSYFAVVGRNTLWPAWQSLCIASILDGTSNTVAIVEDGRSDICWLEPKDPQIDQFIESYYADTTLHAGMGRPVGFADGSVQFLSGKIDRVTLLSLLTSVAWHNTFQNDVWPEELRPTTPEQSLYAPRNSDTLALTDIHASAKQSMNPERNQIWCASFQLAWDKTHHIFEDNLIFKDNGEITTLLNQSTFDPASLSPATMFNAVTDTSREQDQQMLTEIRKRFPDISSSIHQLRKKNGRYQVRLYSVIRKQMPFATRFDRFTSALRFSQAAAPVNSFGLDPLADRENLKTFVTQVTILDDRGDDDCIIQLSTAGRQQDPIVVAMIPPGKTLLDTWTTIEDRIHNPNHAHTRPSLEINETLRIPILDFSLKHHFKELEGLKTTTADEVELTIDCAFMEIRLRLDETGADFMSAGEVAIMGEFGETEYDPDRIRNFTFNRPFFIALKEPQATEPWFLAWIANNELFEPFSR